MRESAIPLRGPAWCAIVAFTVWAGTRGTGLLPSPVNVTRLSVPDVVYRQHDGETRRLDLYLPRDEPTWPPETLRPAVLLVHGGSWIGGSRLDYRRDPWRNATRLSEHGFVVIAADYTLARPGRPSWPAALDDLRAAVRWIWDNAQDYRIDRDRIAVLGQSAGAHLAMMLATEPTRSAAENSSRVQAVISFYGPSDLEVLSQSGSSLIDPIRNFLGFRASDDLAGVARAASPIHRVSRSTPPMLLFHGSDDSWVPVDQSRDLARVLQQNRVPHRLVIVVGSRHGFETIVEAPEKRDLLPEILSFLEDAWKASPSAARSIGPRL